MDFWNRIGAMYQFFNDTPALGQDMATNGPQTDFAYALANTLQSSPAAIDVYPADTATDVG